MQGIGPITPAFVPFRDWSRKSQKDRSSFNFRRASLNFRQNCPAPVWGRTVSSRSRIMSFKICLQRWIYYFIAFKRKTMSRAGKIKAKRIRIARDRCLPAIRCPVCGKGVECEPDFDFLEFFNHLTMFEGVGFVKDIEESTQFAGRFRRWLRQKIEGAVAEMVAVCGSV